MSLKDNIDTSSTSGKLMMHIFASLAEFERDLIIERTQAGRKAAMARGKKMGRPKLKRNKRARAAAMLYAKGMGIDDIQSQLNIKSKSTVYRYLRMEGLEPSSKPYLSKSNRKVNPDNESNRRRCQDTKNMIDTATKRGLKVAVDRY